MNVGRRLYEGEYQTVRQDEESLINKGQFGMTADSRAWLTSHNMHFSRRLNNRGRTLSSMLRLSLSGEEKRLSTTAIEATKRGMTTMTYQV